MKIGFVLDDGLDKPDGVQQYILTLGQWLTHNGHEVCYLVGETKRTDIPHVYSLAKNITVVFNGNKLTIPTFIPVSKSKIKKVLNKEQFDVLHIQTPYHPFFGARVVACADSKTAIVGTFHILPYGMLSRVGTRLLGIWLKSSLKRFDSMVGVSKPAAIFSEQTFKIPTGILPNSVDTTLYKPSKKQPHKNIRIVFLGRLVQRKGCGLLLEALARLKKEEPQLAMTVDICGDGPMRKQLEEYVLENELTDLVEFHGFVSEEQKIDFLQQADIAVFPSISGESFGIVLIEAMACGSGVVLAGNNPGYASVLSEIDGSMLDIKNSERFYQQLKDTISSPKLRASLHTKQQQHVQQFATEVVGKQLLELYQTCKSIKNS